MREGPSPIDLGQARGGAISQLSLHTYLWKLSKSKKGHLILGSKINIFIESSWPIYNNWIENRHTSTLYRILIRPPWTIKLRRCAQRLPKGPRFVWVTEVAFRCEIPHPPFILVHPLCALNLWVALHSMDSHKSIVHPAYALSRVLRLDSLSLLLKGGRERQFMFLLQKSTPRRWQRRWSTADSLGTCNAWSIAWLDYSFIPVLISSSSPFWSSNKEGRDTSTAGKMFSATMAGKVYVRSCSILSIHSILLHGVE